MANTYTLIQAQTLVSSAASVTFSSIPGTYTDLKIVASSRNASTFGTSYVRFNGTTTGYTYRRLFVNLTVVSSDAGAAPFFEEDAVIASARGTDGLDDFGDCGFIEPMKVLLESLGEAPLNKLGAGIMRSSSMLEPWVLRRFSLTGPGRKFCEQRQLHCRKSKTAVNGLA